jgi:TonB family protein
MNKKICAFLVCLCGLSASPVLAQAQATDSILACNADGVVPPKLISSKDFVHYPILAVRQNHEGAAIVEALIGPDGHVTNVRLTTSAGFPELDTASLEQTSGQSWNPATKDGKPIACRKSMTVNWRLTDSPPDQPQN